VFTLVQEVTLALVISVLKIEIEMSKDRNDRTPSPSLRVTIGISAQLVHYRNLKKKIYG
jgi:hypothetical protein